MRCRRERRGVPKMREGGVAMNSGRRFRKRLWTFILSGFLCLIPAHCMQAKGFDLSSLFGGGSDLSSLLGNSDIAGLLGNVDSESMSGVNGVLELLGMVTQHAIKDCEIAAIPDKTYTGDEIKPTLNITYDGERLKKGTDYTVTYSNNVKVGTAKCKITGKGSFKGTKVPYYKCG